MATQIIPEEFKRMGITAPLGSTEATQQILEKGKSLLAPKTEEQFPNLDITPPSKFSAEELTKVAESPITREDIQKFITQQEKLVKQIAGTTKLTPEEEKAQKELSRLQLEELSQFESLRTRPGLDLPTFQRAMSEMERSNRLRRIELQMQLQLAEQRKANLLDSLKLQLASKQQLFSDTLKLLQMSLDDSLGTFTDDEGNVTVLLKNPITGEIKQQRILNISKKQANKEFTNTKWVVGPDNKLVFVGRTSDGDIVTQKTDIKARQEGGGFGQGGLFTPVQVQRAMEEATNLAVKYDKKRIPVTDPNTGEIKMGLPPGLREKVIEQLRKAYGNILTESQITEIVYTVLPDFVSVEEADQDIGDIIKQKVLEELSKSKKSKKGE